MLTPQELKKSPLFQDIGYENYQQMLDCFQAVQRSYRVDEVIYDFSGPAGNAVGVVERGEASLIRIDEEGVATVLEELGPRRCVRQEPGVFHLRPGQLGSGLPHGLRRGVHRLSSYSEAV